MTQPEFCRFFIQNVRSDNLEEIEVITSGFFASTFSSAVSAISGLLDAWLARPYSSRPARFAIRLSLDWFHVQRLGLQHAVNLIRTIDTLPSDDFDFYIRSVLLDGDGTFDALAAQLGGKIGPMADFQRSLTLPSGRCIPIYFKNLILDGRMNRLKLSRLPVALPASALEHFVSRFRDDRGKHVPARVYNGPTVRHLDGLACIVEDDGAVKILEGNAPDRFPRLSEHVSWPDALSFLYADPITRFLVDAGPEALADLLEPAFAGSINLMHDMNQLYYLVDQLLSDPVRLLYATARVIELEAGGSTTGCEASTMDAARRLLAAHGKRIA